MAVNGAAGRGCAGAVERVTPAAGEAFGTACGARIIPITLGAVATGALGAGAELNTGAGFATGTFLRI
jgi:hypothetical protein